MKNNAILTIFKKELARFFKDRRTLIALLMPGLLIYVIYSLMGGAMSDAFMPDEDYEPVIYSVNTPNSVAPIFAAMGLEIIPSENIDGEKDLIVQELVDVLMIFPADFDQKLFSAEPPEEISSRESVPNVEIYYNSSNTNSAMAYQTVVAALDSFE